MTIASDSEIYQRNAAGACGDPHAAASLIEIAGTCGEPMELRPQQRLPRSATVTERALVVRQGVLAVDVMATKGQRQIVDFLMACDIVLPSPMLSVSPVSIRAVTSVLLVYVDAASSTHSARALDHSHVQCAQMRAQLARAYLQQLVVGHLETEARVASFLLAMVLRNGGVLRANQVLPLPMSRNDIADYLAMNRDTLSRIMMRFESLGLIVRENRHAIRVVGLKQLRQLSPISALIDATFNVGSSVAPERVTVETAVAGPTNVVLGNGIGQTWV